MCVHMFVSVYMCTLSLFRGLSPFIVSREKRTEQGYVYACGHAFVCVRALCVFVCIHIYIYLYKEWGSLSSPTPCVCMHFICASTAWKVIAGPTL